jgi:ribosomal-protein-alanine N-acetyltransferase
MTPETMAALAARAYAHATPWTATDFGDALGQPTTLLIDAPNGFLLARVIADEAEILALATDPAAQRQGIATALLARFVVEAAARGARHAFLEVADDNAPARALYSRTGFAETGRRRGYYPRATGAADALILSRALP